MEDERIDWVKARLAEHYAEGPHDPRCRDRVHIDAANLVREYHSREADPLLRPVKEDEP